MYPHLKRNISNLHLLKRAMEAIFVEAWEFYTKQVTDNIITHRLHKFFTDTLATAATEDSQM